MKKWLALALALNLFVAYHGIAARPAPAGPPVNGPLDAALKAKIIRETPGLSAELRGGDTYATARRILRWVAPRIPAAATKGQLLDSTSYSAGEVWYRMFRPLRRGVWCYGASDFYIKTLALFGIEGKMITFGQPSGYTHVTVLVKGPDDRLAMLGPTFNMEIVSRKTGRPVSFACAASIASRSDSNAVLRANTASLLKRPVVFGPHEHATCATVATGGMCGLRFLRTDPQLRGTDYANGVDGLVRLFTDGSLFQPERTPSEIVRAHDDSHSEIAAGRVAQVVLERPL
jgi:hypothetical protein